MYVLSLYFQNPAGLGMSAFEAGLATLPAAAAMIAITPAITPLAAKLGGGAGRRARLRPGRRRLRGAGVRRGVVGVRARSWLPLIGLVVGLGLANGPASSGSTSAVSADQVGQASGISNMARYVGAAVAVAAVAMVNNAVANEPPGGGRLGLRGAGGRPRRARRC